MKKRIFCVLFCMLCLCLPACKKKKASEPVPAAQEAWTILGAEFGVGIQSYALAEDGSCYGIGCTLDETSYQIFSTLIKYDADGNECFSKEYSSVFGTNADIVPAMAVKDGQLYVAAGMTNGDGTLLFSYDEATGTAVKCGKVSEIGIASRLLAGKDYFYLLGHKMDWSKGRKTGDAILLQYARADGETTVIEMEHILDISFNEDGALVILAEENGKKGFFQYDGETNTVKLLTYTEEKRLESFAMGEGESIFYYADTNEAVQSELSRMQENISLYPFHGGRSIYYANGRVLCRAENGCIVKVELANLKKENKTIRFIFREMVDGIYSCGYRMEPIMTDADKISLKVLAMDKDFDLCMINSWDGISRNLKENGNFYSLNDLKGIDTYLDACFPYVREAATKEDGSIWMLPVRVDVPVLLYDTAMEDTLPVPFTSDMTYEEFIAAQEALSKQERKKTQAGFLGKIFLREYFQQNTSIDTEEFRRLAEILIKNRELFPDTVSNLLPLGSNYQKGSYIYDGYPGSMEEFEGTLNRKSYGADVAALGYPKLGKADPNLATCLFLAVNPNSDNLDATLHFLESYMAYMLSKEKPPLFFKQQPQGDTLAQSLYEVYKNAEIAFEIDDTLTEGFDKVLRGKKDLEEFIRETEPKLKMYFGEN